MYYEAAIDIQKQIAFIAALLSGFSIAFLIGLLQLKDTSKYLKACLIWIIIATCLLLISTISSTAGAFWLTERPALQSATANPPELIAAYSWGLGSMILGMIALLGGIGNSGWLHSKGLGIFSSIAAIVTFLLLAIFLTTIVPLD